MKTRNQNRPTSRACWGFARVRGSCWPPWAMDRAQVTWWQLCRSESGKLLLVLCQNGTWGDTEGAAGYFWWLVRNAVQGGNCWSWWLQDKGICWFSCFWTFAFIHATPIDWPQCFFTFRMIVDEVRDDSSYLDFMSLLYFSDNLVTVQYCQLVLITFRHMQVPPKHWFQQEVNCW